ncbi:hypothetical protein I4U23_005850 [Adineta vaga]|nr:hypothetical protein I4U23_005850 [Adineta vaga]
MNQPKNIGSSSLFPSRVSHISNLFPSVDMYEDEHYIANMINRRLPVGSSGTSGRATRILQPMFTEDIRLFDDTGFLAHQLRRSEVSYPYEYKAPANIKQKSNVILRTTPMSMNIYNEEIHETPIHINHARHQQSGGRKKKITSISQIRVLDHYAEPLESSVQLDHRQRTSLSHPTTYKIPLNTRPSTGTILKTHYALTEEEPAQETSINIARLRQPLFANDTTKQYVSSIIQPSTTFDIPIMNETALHLDRVRRPITPQIIHYKPPANIQPSMGSILQTKLALGREYSPEEPSIYINQLRHPMAKDLSDNGKEWVWV